MISMMAASCNTVNFVGAFSGMANYVLGYCPRQLSESVPDMRQKKILCKATHALIRTVHRNEIVCNYN